MKSRKLYIIPYVCGGNVIDYLNWGIPDVKGRVAKRREITTKGEGTPCTAKGEAFSLFVPRKERLKSSGRLSVMEEDGRGTQGN